MFDQTVKHGRHLTAGLARTHHVDIEIAKKLTVLCQRAAQRCTALDGIQDALHEGCYARLVAHVNQHAQGVVERQTGAQHDGQFGRDGEHIGSCHRPLRLAHFGLRESARPISSYSAGTRSSTRALCILDVQRRQPLSTELFENRRSTDSSYAPLFDLARGGGGTPSEVRHRTGPA